MLDLTEVGILLIVVLLAVIFIAVKKNKPPEEKDFKNSFSFLGMGAIWLIVGIIFIPESNSIFDSALLILGLVFTLSGLLGIIIEYFKPS